ncbi:MAG: DUF6569 family protein [Chitinophagales bacterium]
MKTKIVWLLTLLTSTLFAQFNYKNLETKLDLTTEQMKPYTYENLRIYPIYAKESFTYTNKNIGQYTPLNEALAKDKVKITETTDNASRSGSSPTVNTLYIQNTSSDTVYIMAGEVVKGGKQDRVIAQDVILPPKGKKTSLDVYCVEHGRWVHNSGSSNEFKSTSGVVSTGVRKSAEVEKNQSVVWEKVKDVQMKNKTETSTGTYTALEQSKDYLDKTSKYVSYLKTQLAREPQVIGFVAVTGNKIVGCDMFATPVMFKQQADNLLKSYATEAISNGAPPKVTNSEVKTYLDKLLLNEAARPAVIQKDGKEFKKGDKTLHISLY